MAADLSGHAECGPRPPAAAAGSTELGRLIATRVGHERQQEEELRRAMDQAGAPLGEAQRLLQQLRSIAESEMRLIEDARVQLVRERQRLGEEWRLLESERAALQRCAAEGARRAGAGGCPPPPPAAVPADGCGVVELNVGGQTFTTTLATLCAEPASGLAALFRAPGRLPRDGAGRLFLDCASGPFSYILKYLRGERFTVQRSDPEIAGVYHQAQLFGLGGFVRMLDAVLLQQPSPAQPAAGRELSPARWDDAAPGGPLPRAAAEGSPGARPSHAAEGSAPGSPRRDPAPMPWAPPPPPSQQQRPQQPRGAAGHSQRWDCAPPPAAAPAAPAPAEAVQGSPTRFLSDERLHAPLQRALERQQRREAAALAAAEGEQRVGDLQQGPPAASPQPTGLWNGPPPASPQPQAPPPGDQRGATPSAGAPSV
eukprot:TRINITY_DN10296_c1_g2_i2.p1 TRINITY_DN10296_c1_g2~~TRINITY_DN10296_c1_g2_i2.p1  ORF type:complete len:451 (+),score=110.93 TRINITY_DN10296_c1_g2_i2:73-1353(+)